MSGVTECSVCGARASSGQQGVYVPALDCAYDIVADDPAKTGRWLAIGVLLCPLCHRDALRRQIADALRVMP